MFNWDKNNDVLTGKKEFKFRLVQENQYKDDDYENVIYPDLVSLKKQVKAKVVNNNKSFVERYFTWRTNVIPRSL